jgi:phosphoglycerol transferase
MPSAKARARTIAAYGAAAGISTIAAILLLQLWRADLHVPFEYRGDVLLNAFLVKSVIEHGWFWTNPSVGAPIGLELYDFPVSAHDGFHLLLIKLLSLLSKDWALVFNAYFLLGFPLITLSATAVFRHFGVSIAPSIAGAVLYSFLPCRLIKGEGHLLLDVFYQVPLAVMLVLWVCGERPPIVRIGTRGSPSIDVREARSVAALAICALVACSSAYYAFFTCCLLVAGGIWASVERRRMDGAVAGIVLASAIGLGLAANAIPAFVYHLQHGPNQVAQRFAWEAEHFGMKIAPLLLPTAGHRIAALRELKRQYDATSPLVEENASTSLGFVGAFGFLFLMGLVLSGRRSERSPDDPLRPLAVLNLIAVLLGTIGGFGSLFALLISPQIRTYSRISVFIAFFSLFASVFLLQGLYDRHKRLGILVIAVVLSLGLLDQVTPLAVRPYASTRTTFVGDADLVRQIEEATPPDAAVFQLPYMSFPEGRPIHHMTSYDALRPYLHSKHLRWSFPAMAGRAGDAFVRDVSERDANKIVETLASVGFAGILVDRDGYSDNASAVEAPFRQILRAEPVVSSNGTFAFFDLQDYRRRMHLAPSPYELDLLLHPIEFTFSHGCYDVEHKGDGVFRWCRPKGEIGVENRAPIARRVVVKMTMVAAQSPALLELQGDLWSERVALSGSVAFDRVIDVPPGRHRIQFACDGRKADAPTDPRTMVWRIEDFVFEEVTSSSAR